MRIRRSKSAIIARILGCIEEERLFTKTRLMYRANLSFAQLQEYLSLLLELELVREVKEEDRTFYEITVKGERFLEAFRTMKELMTIQNK